MNKEQKEAVELGIKKGLQSIQKFINSFEDSDMVIEVTIDNKKISGIVFGYPKDSSNQEIDPLWEIDIEET